MRRWAGTVRLIEEGGGVAAFSFGDVSKEESVRAMVDFALATYGKLDIACNSAALSRGAGPIHEYERSVFDQTIEMCLTNTWLCMKYEIAAMLKMAVVRSSTSPPTRPCADRPTTPPMLPPRPG